MSKPRVAIFDFACCEGCQLQIVNLEEEILDLVGAVDVVEWREAMSEQSEEYDVAIIEGSITREEDAERLRDIRSKAAVLVALGACAVDGGLNNLKNQFAMSEVRKCVYGKDAEMPHLETSPTRGVGEVVEVDAEILGCPIERAELVHVLHSLLMGKTPEIPSYPVCVECKSKGNRCVWEDGQICLGPVTRAGCGARCPSASCRCYGCRGAVEDANHDAAKEVTEKYGLNVADLKSKMDIFGQKSVAATS